MRSSTLARHAGSAAPRSRAARARRHHGVAISRRQPLRGAAVIDVFAVIAAPVTKKIYRFRGRARRYNPAPKAPMQRLPIQDMLHSTETRLHALLVRGMDGDESAYRSFLQTAATHLRAYLRRRKARWPDDVEDLVQESLLAIHNQRHTYDRAAPLTAWMYAISKYKLIDWLRRHARQDQYNDPLGDEHELFSSTDMDAAEAGRDLGKILDLLPEQQRAAIVHTKLDGWSVRDTASHLRMSEANVKVTVHRGLKALAQKLRQAL
jgi:RNA polymerase sigma-70 factor (ECF subfamily)